MRQMCAQASQRGLESEPGTDEESSEHNTATQKSKRRRSLASSQLMSEAEEELQEGSSAEVGFT